MRPKKLNFVIRNPRKGEKISPRTHDELPFDYTLTFVSENEAVTGFKVFYSVDGMLRSYSGGTVEKYSLDIYKMDYYRCFENGTTSHYEAYHKKE